jgi:SPP1 family predicted phage head-tail adaptor
MRAGRLRQRVVIQYKVVTQNEFGEEVITWTDYLTAWAAVEPLRGREFAEQAMAGAEITTRIVLRWPRALQLRPEMRAVHEGRLYDIQSIVRVDERHREIQLLCREVIPAP